MDGGHLKWRPLDGARRRPGLESELSTRSYEHALHKRLCAWFMSPLSSYINSNRGHVCRSLLFYELDTWPNWWPPSDCLIFPAFFGGGGLALWSSECKKLAQSLTASNTSRRRQMEPRIQLNCELVRLLAIELGVGSNWVSERVSLLVDPHSHYQRTTQGRENESRRRTANLWLCLSFASHTQTLLCNCDIVIAWFRAKGTRMQRKLTRL